MVCQLQAQDKMTYKILSAEEVEEGDGAKVNRVFPRKGVKHNDPFVLLDHFFIRKPGGFPSHFHSGFEVITYVLNGTLQHKDSQGNTENISQGDVQCFTTGSGVVHSEMPYSDSLVEGIQLWINLPLEDKKTTATYTTTRAHQFKWVNVSEGVKYKEIVGSSGLVKTKAELLMRDFTMNNNTEYAFILPIDYHGIVYVLEGTCTINGQAVMQGSSVLFTKETLNVIAKSNVRILLISGLPLQQPIKRKGSIVK